MVAKVILAIAAAAFVGALSGSTDTWARGGKGGHSGGMRSAWMGKNTHGVHGKSGRRHFPRQPRASSRISAEIGRVAAAPVAVGTVTAGASGTSA
jgi:hypothetical protein